MSDPLKGRGLNRKTCGRRAREAARRPPSKPETVATRASVVRDLPPKHGTPRPLGAHISCSRHLCQGNGALPRGRPASEGLQEQVCPCAGPLSSETPESAPYLPFQYSWLHARILDHPTPSHASEHLFVPVASETSQAFKVQLRRS